MNFQTEENLIQNPWQQTDESGESSLPNATLKIYESIDRDLNEKRSNDVDRASSANMCVRRRWYQLHGFESEKLAPRKIVNFFLGDLSERVLLYYIKKALLNHVYSEIDLGAELGEIKFQGKDITLYAQQDLSFTTPQGYKISAHADGWGKRISDGLWELIEIKSAADYGFQSFQKEGPGDYLKQAHALMQTDLAKERACKSVRFFYLRKSTGHVWDRLFHYNDFTARSVLKDFDTVHETNPPDKPYSYVKARDGSEVLPWQCGYCPFKEPCQGPFTKVFKGDRFGNQKPSFIKQETNKEIQDAFFI